MNLSKVKLIFYLNDFRNEIDESFPSGKFKINYFDTPFRLHCNSSSGGIMLFVREDILAKLISSEKSPIEDFYLEVNLRIQKLLTSCSSKSMFGQHVETLSKSVHLHSSTYENFIFLGDFNVGMEHYL